MTPSRRLVHIVDFEAKSGDEMARMLRELGWQPELHVGLDEFLSHAPTDGIVLIREKSMLLPLAQLMAILAEAAIWLPVVVYSVEPRVEKIVDALKSGALDYLALPVDPQLLGDTLARVESEGSAEAEFHRAQMDARRKIMELSTREREVLEWLVEGCANKTIARHLGISPRTVEIHRANMMTKLGADHPCRVVRMFLMSGLSPTIENTNGDAGSQSVNGVRRVDLASRMRDCISGPGSPDRQGDRNDRCSAASAQSIQ